MITTGDVILALANRVKELEIRVHAGRRKGKVVEVDAKAGKARVELMEKGSDGKPVLTGWIPWAEQAAGKGKTHFPVSVGQQVKVKSESGDLTDAEIELSVPSNENKRPSESEDEFVLLDNGGTRFTVEGDRLVITTGEVLIRSKVKIEGDVQIEGDFDVNGGSFTHNGKDVGSTHGHVSAPPGSPGPPV